LEVRTVPTPLRRAPTITRDTNEAQIYRQLRHEILSGTYADGERMVQRAIAERMGTSRIPVRDALKRLEVDGLIVKDEQGTYYCKPFGAEDLEEIYTLRMMLEPLALRRAMSRLDSDHIQYLGELLAAMDEAVRDEDQERYVEINRDFHMTIYEACGKTRLVQIIKSLWSGRPLFIAGSLGTGKSAGEHYDILEAIQSSDVERASQLLHDHIHASYQILRENFLERERA
jgi:DNA-binding GntR family transcriptional regulator